MATFPDGKAESLYLGLESVLGHCSSSVSTTSVDALNSRAIPGADRQEDGEMGLVFLMEGASPRVPLVPLVPQGFLLKLTPMTAHGYLRRCLAVQLVLRFAGC